MLGELYTAMLKLKTLTLLNRQRFSRAILLCVGAILIQYSSASYSQSDALESAYIQFSPGAGPWQGELQTAVISFRNQQGIEVDLVAAVHIGDSEYYQQLNGYFKTRDRVLYELVAEVNDVPGAMPRSNNRSALGFIQRVMANFLNVSFQLDEVDYTAGNFQHADLTPTQLQEIMQSKNENFLSMFLSLAMAQSAELQAADSNGSTEPALNMMSIINALNSENQSDAFKSLFAKELGRSGGIIVGPAMEAQLTILGDRNKVVLDRLRDTLQDSQIKTVSIFFGAAHMSGIERELTGSMGFEKTGQRWLPAWIIP